MTSRANPRAKLKSKDVTPGFQEGWFQKDRTQRDSRRNGKEDIGKFDAARLQR